jgi:hypothetical protein
VTARSFWVIPPPKFDFLVRVLVFLATIFWMVNLFARFFAPDSVAYFLFLTICPLSFWYVVKANSTVLVSIWRHDFGKLAYGVLATITVTGGKVWADQEIRDVLQSNPALFPSAQQSITLYNIFLLVLLQITLLIAAVMMFHFLAHMINGTLRRSSRGFFDVFPIFMAYFYAYAFMTGLTILSDFDFVGRVITGRHENPIEELIIWSSFVPNARASGSFGGAVAERFCTNLEPDVWVSPVNSREAMPNEVMVVKRQASPHRFGRDHQYRLASCDNSANPTAGRAVSPVSQ